MSAQRLAIISRRFWPLLGEAETLLADLAQEFIDQGYRAEIATARWEKNWPTEVVYRDISVTRLNQPKARGWGTARYMQSLSNWIRRNRHDLDGLLISGLRHDAHTAVRCGRMYDIPTVVIGEGVGEMGDCHWQTVGRFGLRMREMTTKADAWVAPTDAVQAEMIEAGYSESRGRVIAPGVPLPARRTAELRDESRRALADTHQVFAVPCSEPLVVYAGVLEERKGVTDLISAWRFVVDQWPQAKLWLLGDGPHAHALWQEIRHHELTHTIIMPGAFDDLTEVFYAADAFVLPSHEEAISLTLLRAMSVGTPVVATDIPANRLVIKDQTCGTLVSPGQPRELLTGLCDVLEDPSRAAQIARTARNLIDSQFSVQRMAIQYLELLRELTQDQRQRPKDV